MSQQSATLQTFVWQLRDLGYDVRVTTSANMPFWVDGCPMAEGQFHAMAHGIIYPRRRPSPPPPSSPSPEPER